MSESPKFDLSTSEGGRGYIAHLFKTVLKRHDFTVYITERLAADFACALARHFEGIKAREAALQQRLTAADQRIDLLEGLLRLARGAIGENQWTLLTKDIDLMVSPDTGRTNTSGKAHCPHDGICHTSEETCAEAQARIDSLTVPVGAGQ